MTDLIPLFVDLDGTVIKEDIGQLALKKHISHEEFSYISYLLKNSDLKKNLLFFEINSKKKYF